MIVCKVTMVFAAICLISNVLSSPYQNFISANYLGNSTSMENYQIRVKQPISCEKSVQYSGYIDNLVTGDHVFFVFMESKYASRKDPIILSLNGQTGCSSILDSWLETGLCLMKSAGIETNPFSINNVANILYVDQPSDVGFSYSTSHKKDSTSKQVSESVYWFLQCFLEQFKQFAENEFHIAGTSYAAHYVPSLATHIIRQNKYAISKGRLPIKLASIIIGNGYISPRAHQLSYADYACDKNRYDKYGPLFDAFTCKRMKINRERCEFLWNQCSQGYGSCTAASIFCKKTLIDPFHSTIRNPYDIRKRCTRNNEVDSCYDEIRNIEDYVNRQDIKTIYGVDFAAGDFSNCNPHVKTRFDLHMDSLTDTMDDVVKILSTDVRVLIYSGDLNWYNNWYGQRDWASSLDWNYQVEFNERKEENWYSYVSGRKAGTVKKFKNLAFVKVFNAGYYATYDQPENMIDLYSRWIMNTSLTY